MEDIQHLQGMENEIQESTLSQESEEISVYVTGYIIKKLLKRIGCIDCKHLLLSEENVTEDKYIKLLNRGGLLILSSNVCFYSSKCFAILDVIFDVLFKYNQNDIRNCAEYFLDKSFYHQLTFAVPLSIHPVVSGCAELFPTYISTTIKKFQFRN